jgi:hypothetical protein
LSFASAEIGERRFLERAIAALGAGTASHAQFDPDYGWQQWGAPVTRLGNERTAAARDGSGVVAGKRADR